MRSMANLPSVDGPRPITKPSWLCVTSVAWQDDLRAREEATHKPRRRILAGRHEIDDDPPTLCGPKHSVKNAAVFEIYLAQRGWRPVIRAAICRPLDPVDPPADWADRTGRAVPQDIASAVHECRRSPVADHREIADHIGIRRQGRRFKGALLAARTHLRRSSKDAIRIALKPDVPAAAHGASRTVRKPGPAQARTSHARGSRSSRERPRTTERWP